MDDQINGTQTDENGNFELNFLAHKHQQISISYVGYESESIMLQEWPENRCLTIKLKIDENLLGDYRGGKGLHFRWCDGG